MLQHILVMEAKLGRSLAVDEEVHHVNHVRDDNQPENLEVVKKGDHQRMHNAERPAHSAGLTCQRCGAGYLVKPSKVGESKFCSNACRLAALHEGNRKT